MAGLLSRLRRPSGGERGIAKILRSEPLEHDREGPSHVLDVALDHFGSIRYRLGLEVRLPGRDPYEADGEWRVPNRALGAAGGGGVLAEGIELPVTVAGGGEITVDWDAYRADPGRKEAQREAQQSRRNRRVSEELGRNPAMQARIRSQGAMRLQAWTGAVRAGAMSREDFERTVRLEVETGRMDAAEADAARRSLD